MSSKQRKSQMTNSLGVALPFPRTSPVMDPVFGKSLAQKIFDKSYELLGPQKPGIAFGFIKFGGQRPHVMIRDDDKMVAVQLSDATDHNWESFVGEFSHETVHLLDPRRGNGSYLEEGIAEKFSAFVQDELGIAQMPQLIQEYVDATAAVDQIPGDPFEFAKQVREKLGALTGFTADELVQNFPEIDIDLASRLSAMCRTVE